MNITAVVPRAQRLFFYKYLLKQTLPQHSERFRVWKPVRNRHPCFVLFLSSFIMKVAVIRKAHFNAAHRLHNPSWSDQKNQEVFGLCNNPNWHGHNYELEVKVSGDIDPETGMVIDLGWLADLIKQEIELRFDHKNLNLDTVEFRNLNPTAENMCVVIWQILRAKLPEILDLHIRLYETPRNFVEFPA